jgi:Concanavalin A-like lectin/glucanases superfamily
MTIEGWIKPVFTGRPLVDCDVDTVLAKFAGSPSLGYGFGLAHDPGCIYTGTPAPVPDGTVGFDLNVSGVRAALSRGRVANDGRFHHVAATYDGSAMRVYIDGTLQGETQVQGTLMPSNAPATIGFEPNQPRRSAADIDEVTLYNHALSPSEIQAIFAAGSNGKCVAPTIDLVADGLEVTQSVQDLNNTVPLVANKRTYVRFHVHSVGGSAETTARLTVSNGSEQVILAPLNAAGRIVVRPDPNRAVLDDAFLFALPSGFESGTIQLTAQVNPDNDPQEVNRGNNSRTLTASFADVPQQSLVLYSVGYQQNGQVFYPPDIDRAQLVLWMQRAFPLSDLQVVERTYIAGSGVPDCGQVNTYLLSKRLWDLAHSTDVPANTHYYGMVSDEGGFMRGCAVSIPSFVASGPTGVPGASFTWDTDGSYGDWYGGHELAHTWGRTHANFCGATGGTDASNPDGRISPALTGDTAIYGFDIFTRAIYPPTWKDVMTYCDYEWVSDITYEGLLGSFQSNAAAGDAPAAVDQIDRLLVVGTIDPQTSAVKLNPLFVIPDAGDLKPRMSGDYAIVLRDAGGGELARYPFTPDRGEGGEGDPERDVAVLFINELLPYDARTAEVDIEGPAGTVLPGGSVRAGLSDPSVHIVSSEGGAAASDETVTLTWAASDPDGDPLSFDVQYSADGGTNWETVAQNIPQSFPTTSVDLDRANLKPSGQPLFRVFVTDGIHTTFADSAAAPPLANRPPTATITFPATALWTLANSTLPLQAQVSDPDGPLPKDNVRWYASTDQTLGEVLGSGTTLSVPTCESGCPLSLGSHTVTLQVTDGASTVSAQIEVTVVSADLLIKCGTNPTPDCPNQLEADPISIICTPDPGASVVVGVRNQAHSDASIQWTATRRAGWVHLYAPAGSTASCTDNTCSGTTQKGTLGVRCTQEGLATVRHSSIDLTSPNTFGQSQRIEVQLTPCSVGDCDGGGDVAVSELITMVNIALGSADPGACAQGDSNGDGRITIDEIVAAVNQAVKGCE